MKSHEVSISHRSIFKTLNDSMLNNINFYTTFSHYISNYIYKVKDYRKKIKIKF